MSLHIGTPPLLAFCALAAYLAWAEAGVVLPAAVSAGSGIEAARNADAARPFSLGGIRTVLGRCDRALAYPFAELRGAAFLAATTAACRTAAERAARLVPGEPLAPLVLARVAEKQGDGAAMRSALEASFRAAPFEGWLAERRFVMVMGRNGDAAAAVPETLDADLDTLLSTQSGAELVGRYYVRRPALRPWLSAAAARATPADRQRFANQTRAGAASR